MRHASRKLESLSNLSESVHRQVPHHQFRRPALVAAGILTLAVGMVTAALAAPSGVDESLSRSQVDAGLFQFDIYQLQKGSGPTFLLQGADGNLWFSNILRHQMARFDVGRQQLRTFALHPTSTVLVMSNGPDGNVWYADNNGKGGGTIASITPAGKVTEINMPGGRGAAGLGPGPDGNLWITEGVNNAIARYNLHTRTFTEFKLPHPRSGPCKIAAGSDGAIWFTELGAGRIGRITMDGEIKEFLVPTRDSMPFMIVSGPDGALWFTEYNAGNIGKITTTGEITEFPTSSIGTAPMHIVVAPDKNLWFTETGSNSLGRITTGGALTEFSFGGSNTHPDGITVGSDRRVWFTQWTGNALGAVISPR